jgi:5'-nucleotidase
MGQRLKILLTNDDGFSSPGISSLYRVLKRDFDVTVVAPEQEQSGVGHAFSYKKPLVFEKRLFLDNDMGYSVSGTPADCVKIALGHILTAKPDMVVSGINFGSNTGVAGFYSGTVAAVREGAFWQVQSMAFSLSESKPCYFAEYAEISCNIIKNVLLNDKVGLKNARIFFNVNFPPCPPDRCAGTKITRQSLSFYDDMYIPRKRENGITEYWLEGGKKDVELQNEYDTCAVENNYIAITPLQIDATAFDCIASLEGLKQLHLKE